MKTVALFTSFSPDTGGGGACLRSLLPLIAKVRVRWFYLGKPGSAWPGATCIGRNLIGGTFARDLCVNSLYWSGIVERPFRRICRVLSDCNPDGFWVVSHNEGMLVAKQLLKQYPGKLHLTVQDDQERGVFARSRRYRAISRLARTTANQVLSAAPTLDVISEGMQTYYGDLLGKRSTVVRPVISELQDLPVRKPPANEICVGHIGTVYSVDEVRQFCIALSRLAKSMGVKASMLFVGNSARYRNVSEGHTVECEFIEELRESDAVMRLASCAFLYAMYPFDGISEVFRRTSLPTKLTTYLKAQRPVFAHTPVPSSLASFVENTNIGLVCPSRSAAEIQNVIDDMLRISCGRSEFEAARMRYYSPENAVHLEHLLMRMCEIRLSDWDGEHGPVGVGATVSRKVT